MCRLEAQTLWKFRGNYHRFFALVQTPAEIQSVDRHGFYPVGFHVKKLVLKRCRKKIGNLWQFEPERKFLLSI